MTHQILEFEKPIVALEEKLHQLLDESQRSDIDLSDQINEMRARLIETKEEIYANLTPWQRVQIARHTQRPFMLDYVGHCFDDFLELHGDRHIGDDQSMPGGIARLDGMACVVLGHQKGRDTKENLLRNFGSAHPEGYRKSLRLMRMAEKFNMPIVAFIDTPGAFPGIGAEERNIAEAIAFNLREMMRIKTPIVAVVIGEGGSGGALGIGVADRVLMMENAYYSVISPEGCAAILWKHRKHAPEAAEAMKIAAPDLAELGLIDGVINEPKGGAHQNPESAAAALKGAIAAQIAELTKLDDEELLNQRYEKYRKFGEWTEA
ncbi:acetyl-CoA carboxylase carboxyltransferase subunit alpha [Sulfuriroseicoccus oceanibius]|uniref:Acetyl-coenzyme A carboxylase carboxyl transferase subunit alpha n=1 Tax=Sulfuriroseicoccus oceanibius TaxID=2707525 RepID=A0A6B3L9F4_9BACT|nr:acetyl-CoA carboxylase carboxyltransferase subunit alpha [Sulfuriroseicoccus oceanibius]QQL44208.1 acetyl-CoA carboxylase carboxyltransferase subunit alpha [Sulfuriroseicoccus oceanibius]